MQVKRAGLVRLFRVEALSTVNILAANFLRNNNSRDK